MKAAFACAGLLVLFGLGAQAVGPLAISADGRHLVDEHGDPFLFVGDSAWSLMAQPTLAEAELYLDDRAARGFNVIVVNLLEHAFADYAPANANGDEPFTGTTFVTPNEAYFAHVDAVMDLAVERDIVFLMAPVYQGWGCTNEGWCYEMQWATLAQMRDWGRYVGQRYGSYDNIVWSIGGDADPTVIADKLREFVAGLREYDTTHLITAHGYRGTQAVTFWPGEPWLQVNNIFTPREAIYQSILNTYSGSPGMPFFVIEGRYEHMFGFDDQDIRAQSYWSVLGGGFGLLFGNCPLWHFGYSSSWCGLVDWQAQLGLPGSVQMTHYRALFESRRWTELVPDDSGALVQSGGGTWGAEDYLLAAAAADGSSIIAYVPTPRAVTLDTSGMSGSTVRAWWFNPSDGTTQLLSDFPKGPVSIPPAVSDDRVLVIDDLSLGFGPPGSSPLTDTPVAREGTVELLPNRPNPFNPTTEIRYVVERAGVVRVSVYDAAGRRVRVLLDRFQEAGEHQLRWDGRDDDGLPLASGTYLCQLESDSLRSTRKLVLVK